MKISLNIFIFFLCNFIGITVIATIYAIALIYKFVDIEASNFILNIRHDMGYSMMAWAACSIFSFSSFFLSQKWKIFFLISPIIIPFIFSVILLSRY